MRNHDQLFHLNPGIRISKLTGIKQYQAVISYLQVRLRSFYDLFIGKIMLEPFKSINFNTLKLIKQVNNIAIVLDNVNKTFKLAFLSFCSSHAYITVIAIENSPHLCSKNCLIKIDFVV